MRRFVWRLGRRLYVYGRGETSNSIQNNGEARLQRELKSSLSADSQAVVFDIGANEGHWLEAFDAGGYMRSHDNVRVLAFEPVPSTRQRLEVKVAAIGGSIEVHPLALSDREGTAELAVRSETGGTNTLAFDDAVRSESLAVLQIETATIDGFCARHGIERVDLIKCDTEGHDFAVIRGAERMLREKRVGALQFEYNSRWVYARAFLKDVFDFVKPLGYRVGRLGATEIELFEDWHPELERFFEGNYVILPRDERGVFTARLCAFDVSNVYA